MNANHLAIAEAIAAEIGMTGDGTLMVEDQFNEPRMMVKTQFESVTTWEGRHQRYTLLAFLLTQPRSMYAFR